MCSSWDAGMPNNIRHINNATTGLDTAIRNHVRHKQLCDWSSAWATMGQETLCGALH